MLATGTHDGNSSHATAGTQHEASPLDLWRLGIGSSAHAPTLPRPPTTLPTAKCDNMAPALPTTPPHSTVVVAVAVAVAAAAAVGDRGMAAAAVGRSALGTDSGDANSIMSELVSASCSKAEKPVNESCCPSFYAHARTHNQGKAKHARVSRGHGAHAHTHANENHLARCRCGGSRSGGSSFTNAMPDHAGPPSPPARNVPRGSRHPRAHRPCAYASTAPGRR